MQEESQKVTHGPRSYRYRLGLQVYEIASSAESVGEFRLGQSAKGMIQADFHGVAGAKIHRFSGGRFCLVVEPFDNAAGKLALGSKPVRLQGGMRPLISKTPYHPLERPEGGHPPEPTCLSVAVAAGGRQPASNGEEPFDDPLYEPVGSQNQPFLPTDSAEEPII